MGIAKIPQQRQWNQPNTSVLFGNIYATKNMDFSLPGFMKLAPRTRYVYRENVSGSSFDHVLSIVYGDFGGTTSGGPSGEGYYLVTSDGIYLLDDDLDGCAQLTNASPPSTIIGSTDAVSWNNGLYVSESTSIEHLTAGTWTDIGLSLTSGIPHPLCVGFNNLLLIGNGNELDARDTGGTDFNAVVVIPDNFRIQWIRSFNKNVWIGTRNLSNDQAKVFQWDGSSENFNNEYEVDTPWIYSGVSWNGNLYIMTADGRLMSFNGAGFSETGRLPAYTDIITSNDYLWSDSFALGTVYQRGLAIVDGIPHVMLNAESKRNNVTEDATNKFMAGVWAYDPTVGFHHKYGGSNSSAATDFGSMTTGSGAGALSPVLLNPSASTLPDPADGGTVLFGARLKTGDGTDFYTLNSVTTGINRGYFWTTRIESPEVQESWRYVWLKFEEFTSADDKIILKYRTKYRTGLPFTTASNVTYTSSAVFTSTDANFANVVAGDEVTILDGFGAGSTAHIATISNLAGTYTVTLDEAITGVSATNVALVSVDNFHKLSPVISTETEDGENVTARYAKITIPVVTATDYQPAPSEWLEIKGELRGDKVKLSELAVLSESQTLIIF